MLVAAFRDGGAGYLALDITSPGAGVSDEHGPYPKLLWEFTHVNLGHSWSRPVITRVKVAGSTGSGDHCGMDDGEGDCREQWVAIFGGGYEIEGDPNEETYLGDPTNLAWTGASKSVFMVALDSGDVLASVEFDASGTDGPAEMRYSIPSAPAVIDLNHDGFADVVYIGDLGGQLWKWDVSAIGADSGGSAQIDNWSSGVFFRSAPTSVSGGGHSLPSDSLPRGSGLRQPTP